MVTMRRLNGYKVIEVWWLSGIENFVSERNDCMFNLCRNFKPVKRFQNRSDVLEFWSLNNSSSKRIMDVGETIYLIFWKTGWAQWSSGSTLACYARGPRFESRCGQKFVFSRKSLRYAALGTGCTLTAVPRSTQPSTLRGTVNEYQPYG